MVPLNPLPPPLVPPPTSNKKALIGGALALGGIALFGVSFFAALAAARLTGRLSSFNFVASMGRHAVLTLGLSLPGIVVGLGAFGVGVGLLVKRPKKIHRTEIDPVVNPAPQPQYNQPLWPIREKVNGLSAATAHDSRRLNCEIREDIVNCLKHNDLERLRQAMNELKNNQSHLELIVSIIFEASDKPLDQLQTFLHSLSEFSREQHRIINEHLSFKIAEGKTPQYNILELQEGTVNEGRTGDIPSSIAGHLFIWGSDNQPNNNATYRIQVNLRPVLGKEGDYIKNSPQYQIKVEIVELIGRAMILLGLRLNREIKNNLEQNRRPNKVGIELSIVQFDRLRFPASVIVPFLDHIIDLPGLVSLKLDDVGIQRRSGYEASIPAGFGNEDKYILLNIFQEQPHLKHVILNIDRMTNKNEFEAEWDAIKAAHADKGTYLDSLRARV